MKTSEVKVTATTESGKKGTATIKLCSPKIKSVTWAVPIKKRGSKKPVDAKEITETTNGVNTRIYIETEDAKGCFVLLVFESDVWGKYYEAKIVDITNEKSVSLNDRDMHLFKPDIKKWQDPQKKKGKLFVTAYLCRQYRSHIDGLTRNSKNIADDLAKEYHFKNYKHDYMKINCVDAEFRNLTMIKSKELDFHYCGHGMEYREDVFTKKYNAQYGPVYDGETLIQNFSGWDDLIKDGKATQSEKRVISVMAKNEGKLESVQSYDSEIVSVGAMQKTIGSGYPNLKGEGELSQQIYEFQNDYKNAWEKYKCCFEHHQWTFSKEKGAYLTKYKGKLPSESTKTEMRKEYQGANLGKTSEKILPIEPFIKLAHDNEFQEKQALDFVKRIRKALAYTLSTYSNRTILRYIKSPLGMATVLDHDVSRPAHVSTCFEVALDRYIAGKKEKKVIIDKDPSLWGDNHSTYEKELLDIYGPIRGDSTVKILIGGVERSASMTNATERYNNLKKVL